MKTYAIMFADNFSAQRWFAGYVPLFEAIGCSIHPTQFSFFSEPGIRIQCFYLDALGRCPALRGLELIGFTCEDSMPEDVITLLRSQMR